MFLKYFGKSRIIKKKMWDTVDLKFVYTLKISLILCQLNF